MPPGGQASVSEAAPVAPGADKNRLVLICFLGKALLPCAEHPLSARPGGGLGKPSFVKKVLRILTQRICFLRSGLLPRDQLDYETVTFNLFIISILFPALFLNLLAARSYY